MDPRCGAGFPGLIGSESVAHFAALGYEVVGIDNDLRCCFFGPDASTQWNRRALEARYPAQYTHVAADIRDKATIEGVFGRRGQRIAVAIHTAAQPS